MKVDPLTDEQVDALLTDGERMLAEWDAIKNDPSDPILRLAKAVDAAGWAQSNAPALFASIRALREGLDEARADARSWADQSERDLAVAAAAIARADGMQKDAERMQFLREWWANFGSVSTGYPWPNPSENPPFRVLDPIVFAKDSTELDSAIDAAIAARKET